MYIQTFEDKGAKKESILGGFGSGCLNKMLSPKFKNGFVI